MRLKSREALNQQLYVYKLPDDQFVSCTTKVRDSCKNIKHVVTDLKTNTLLGISLENSIDITLENITQHTTYESDSYLIDNSYTRAAYYVGEKLSNYLDASHGTYMKAPESLPPPKTTVYLLLDNSAIYNSIKNYVDMRYQMPVDRLVIGFFRPDVDLSSMWKNPEPSFTFENIGFGKGMDLTFTVFQKLIRDIKFNCGVKEVYLSMGGWNFNCYPKFAQNSHSHQQKQYWKKDSSINNMYHHVCSPSGPDRTAYTFFPDPAYNSKLDQNISGDIYDYWSIRIRPGFSTPKKVIPKWQWPDDQLLDLQTYDNLVNSESDCRSAVEGGERCSLTAADEVVYKNFGYIDLGGRVDISSTEFIGQAVDPIRCYDSFVEFAAKVEADGIDLDYEETWHADTFKVGNAGPALHTSLGAGGAGGPWKWKTAKGPYMFSQTKGKFARIVAVLKKAIDRHGKGKGKLKLSMPGPAVGFNDTRYGNTSWYGGNLKGLYLNDEMCGTEYTPIDASDTGLWQVSKKSAKKISTNGCGREAYHWFNYPDMFKILGMPDSLFNKLTVQYDFWNKIFDGGMFPMIYDLGGGVSKDLSNIKNLKSDTGSIGTFECGPYINYMVKDDDPPQLYRPPGVAPYSCDLISQLKFYSDQYIDNGIKIALGFEIGLPNYPRADDTTNPVEEHTFDTTIIPDKKSFNIELSQNYTNFYNNFKQEKYTYGTFFWELFKQPPALSELYSSNASELYSSNASDCIKTDFSFGWAISQTGGTVTVNTPVDFSVNNIGGVIDGSASFTTIPVDGDTGKLVPQEEGGSGINATYKVYIDTAGKFALKIETQGSNYENNRASDMIGDNIGGVIDGSASFTTIPVDGDTGKLVPQEEGGSGINATYKVYIDTAGKFALKIETQGSNYVVGITCNIINNTEDRIGTYLVNDINVTGKVGKYIVKVINNKANGVGYQKDKIYSTQNKPGNGQGLTVKVTSVYDNGSIASAKVENGGYSYVDGNQVYIINNDIGGVIDRSASFTTTLADGDTGKLVSQDNKNWPVSPATYKWTNNTVNIESSGNLYVVGKVYDMIATTDETVVGTYTVSAVSTVSSNMAILVLDHVSAAHNGQILNDSSSNKVEAIGLHDLVTKMCKWKSGSSCEWPHYPELSGGFYDMSRTCISGSWMTSDNKYMQS